MSTDLLLDGHKDVTAPAKRAFAVTPSDSVALTIPVRSLFIGVGGNLSVEMYGTGSAIVFKNVPSGSILPIMVSRVNSTATTATDIVGLY